MRLDAHFDQTVAATAEPKTGRELLSPGRPTLFIADSMDITPVCAAQRCDFRDRRAELFKLDCGSRSIFRFLCQEYDDVIRTPRTPLEPSGVARGS